MKHDKTKTDIANSMEKRACAWTPTVTRVAAEGDAPAVVRIGGYAAVFNSETQICPWLRESIAPGAFADSLTAGDDVRALFNHDENNVLGRTKASTLRLSEDDKGLRYEVDLPDTTVGRDIATSIARGDVSGSSFAFQCLADKCDNSDPAMTKRTILKVKLFDVSPCTYPAYQDTTVAMRRAGDCDAADGDGKKPESADAAVPFEADKDVQRSLDDSLREKNV